MSTEQITAVSAIVATLCTVLTAYLSIHGKKIDSSSAMTNRAFDSLTEQVARLEKTIERQENEIKELQLFRKKYEELKLKYEGLKKVGK